MGRGLVGSLWRRAYLPILVAPVALIAWGFWPTYYGPLIVGVANKPWLIHAHAAIFAGWFGLLLAQIVLAATSRIDHHRRWGRVGIVYGVLVLLLGLIVAVWAPVNHIHAGEMTLDRAAASAVWSVGDMLMFGGFFGAAVWYRDTPGLHKKLMMTATVVLVSAGVGRTPLVERPLLLLALWLSPLIALSALDLYQCRRIHPVLLLSIAVLALSNFRFSLGMQTWLGIGRSLVQPFV